MAGLSPDMEARATDLLHHALRTTGAADPRGLQRTLLRELRQVNPDGFDQALSHYRDQLIPTIADDNGEPLSVWADYGRLVAGLIVAGEAVSVGPDGLATPYSAPLQPDELVLHLPSGKGRALVVATPAKPSPAQDATRAFLVEGRQSLPTAGQ